MTIKIHLIEYFIIIMHAPCELQAGIALLQHSSPLSEQNKQEKLEIFNDVGQNSAILHYFDG